MKKKTAEMVRVQITMDFVRLFRMSDAGTPTVYQVEKTLERIKEYLSMGNNDQEGQLWDIVIAAMTAHGIAQEDE